MPSPEDHWLVRASTIKWIGSIVLLGFLVLLDFFVHHHAYFDVDGTFGFHAVYGFFACVVLVLVSNGLGLLLKRPDNHYDR